MSAASMIKTDIEWANVLPRALCPEISETCKGFLNTSMSGWKHQTLTLKPQLRSVMCWSILV
jgi:hypothetical protein